MTFLDLSAAPNASEKAPAIPAGLNSVTLTKLTYVVSKDKGLAVFSASDGAEYLEWLSFTTDGSKKRSRAFLNHMNHLSGVRHDLRFEGTGDFDTYGTQVVESCPALTILLAEDIYEGKTKVVLDGFFDKAILVDAGDDQSVPF